MLKIRFKITAATFSSDEMDRLCYFLSHRKEYRNVYVIKPMAIVNGFRFVRLDSKDGQVTTAFKSVFTCGNPKKVKRVFFECVNEEFSEREICFWIRCFALFGILLDDSETKWRFRLKWADVSDKLRQIPRPRVIKIDRVFVCLVTFKDPSKEKDTKYFTLAKCCYHTKIRVLVFFHIGESQTSNLRALV
jgi:hypothetical protein